MPLILTRSSNGPTVRNFCSKLRNRKCICSSSKAKSPTLSSVNFGFHPYEYTSGLLDAGISRITDETSPTRPAFRGTAEEHVMLLSKAEAVLEALSRDFRIEKIFSPLLLHPDLHKWNIFVDPDDPTKITAIIDWQSTCLDPALLYFNEVPDLCEHPRGIAHDVLDKYDVAQDQSPEEVELEDRLRKEVAILRAAWEFKLEASSPRLRAAQTQDQTIIRPFRHCCTTRQQGICGFYSDLLSLSQEWVALGLPGSCPYQPTEEELAKQTARWEAFESELNLKKGLMNFLFTDKESFVHADNWNNVKEVSDALSEKWVSDADADGMGLAWRRPSSCGLL